MEDSILLTLLIALLPIIGIFIGYYINNFLAKKREIELTINKEKREAYEVFLNLLIDIFASTKKGKHIAQSELLERVNEFQKRSLMYASPEVINAFGDCWIALQKQNQDNPTDLLTNMTEVILAFRRDLGLSNKDLGEKGQRLLKGILTDYDNHFEN